MIDIDGFKKAINELDNGSDLMDFFNSHSKILSDEAGNQRRKKGEEKTKAQEFEAKFGELLAELKAADKDDAVGKIIGYEAKLKELTDSMGALQEKFGNSEKEKETEREKKEKALLSGEMISAISNKKVSDKDNILRDVMVARAKKNDSGQFMIGEQTPEEFLQSQIDSREPMFKDKDRYEKIPEKTDTYSLDELDNLSRHEYKANKEKVDRSIRA